MCFQSVASFMIRYYLFFIGRSVLLDESLDVIHAGRGGQAVLRRVLAVVHQAVDGRGGHMQAGVA